MFKIFIKLTLRPIAVTMAPVMYSRNPDDTCKNKYYILLYYSILSRTLTGSILFYSV